MKAVESGQPSFKQLRPRGEERVVVPSIKGILFHNGLTKSERRMWNYTQREKANFGAKARKAAVYFYYY